MILFACEVAAGIWGFVNKDQVSHFQVVGQGCQWGGQGLGLGALLWAGSLGRKSQRASWRRGRDGQVEGRAPHP